MIVSSTKPEDSIATSASKLALSTSLLTPIVALNSTLLTSKGTSLGDAFPERQRFKVYQVDFGVFYI